MEPNSNQTTPTSFWHRQFSENPNPDQNALDFILGILAPLICLMVDPFFFRYPAFMDVFCPTGPFVDDPLSPKHLAIFAYSLIGFEMLALLIWLIARRWLDRVSAVFAGIFFAGTISAVALGIGLLPFSIAALMFLFGICGLTPFLTSLVYLRNGIRAWRMARQQKPAKPFSWLLALALTASLAVYVIPAYIQWQAWVSYPETRIVRTPVPCPPDP